MEKDRQYLAASMYEQWRNRISEKREDMTNMFTPRGNLHHHHHDDDYITAVTIISQ